MADQKYPVGLVLEGGGMRGIFTAGVLDCMLDYKVKFPYIIGTSAGATTGLSYLSLQKGRSRYCDTDLMLIHNYIGLKPMVGGHGVIDMDFLFETFPSEYYPFDFETYRESGARFIMVASDATTGKAVYLEEYDDIVRFTNAARASCSLPIVCPMGGVDGVPMVDGGVTDSIPFERALADGCEKIVVVMTKEKGYRKDPGPIYLPSIIYRKYPNLREALRVRNDAYNAQIDLLEKLEKEGKAFVIRPIDGCGVGRTTDNVELLDKLYDHGYKLSRDTLEAMNDFINR